MKVEVHTTDSCLRLVSILLWSIIIHQSKNFETPQWCDFNHFIDYLWNKWTDNCPVTDSVYLDCWLDYGACIGDTVLRENFWIIWTLHFDIYEQYRCFFYQIENLIKGRNHFTFAKIKCLQLLTSVQKGKTIRLSILRKLAIVTSVENHWYSICTYPNIKLDSFDSMLYCKSEILQAIFWTKIASSVSHYDCLSIKVCWFIIWLFTFEHVLNLYLKLFPAVPV